MIVPGDNELLEASIEALGEAGKAVDRIQPSIALALGDIASRGASREDQVLIDRLADVADTLQGSLDFIFNTINEVTPFLPSKPEFPLDSEDLPEPSDSPISEELFDFDHELISSLGLTPNEQASAILALDYLSQDGQRHGFRDILRAAFGQSRIPRNEEHKFNEILAALSQYGVLRRYGKAFSNKSNYEYLTDATRTEEEKPLDDVEHGIIEYIKNQINENVKTINIGQIIRKHLGIEVLPKEEHQELIRVLNSMAIRGYLTHEERSPWYGLGDRPAQIESPISHQPILTPAVMSLEQLVGRSTVVEEMTSEPEGDNHEQQEPSNIEQNLTQLDGLEIEVLEFSIDRDFYRMEELHKGVASISELDNKDAEYTDFKSRFPKIRETIVEALKAQGIVAHWEEAGRQRGKKYKLVKDGKVAPIPETRPSAKVEEVRERTKPESAPRRLTTVPRTDFVRPIISRPLSEREQKIKFRRDAFFAARLTEAVTESLIEHEESRVRHTTVRREVASALGISEEEAVTALDNLVRSGAFHNGSEDGYKMISLEPIEKGKGGETQIKTDRVSKSEFKALRDSDVSVAAAVYDELLKLRHIQQGIEPKDLIKQLGVSPEDEVEFRRSLRRLEGKGLIVINNNANANTRSDHSKKMYVPWVMLPNQAFKMRLKDNKSAVLSEIQAMVEVDSETV